MSDVTTELANEANDKAMEIARLKADNDRLQNDADLLRAMWSQERTEKRCHMAENAKLRELVLCLLTCSSDTGDACDKCPVNGGSGIWEFEDFCDSLLDRVHELRVGVDA